jgi:hypothetical protein
VVARDLQCIIPIADRRFQEFPLRGVVPLFDILRTVVFLMQEREREGAGGFVLGSNGDGIRLAHGRVGLAPLGDVSCCVLLIEPEHTFPWHTELKRTHAKVGLSMGETQHWRTLSRGG